MDLKLKFTAERARNDAELLHWRIRCAVTHGHFQVKLVFDILLFLRDLPVRRRPGHGKSTVNSHDQIAQTPTRIGSPTVSGGKREFVTAFEPIRKVR